MRTMFVAQEHGGNGRRKYQKPNILRRRSKPPTKQNISVSSESPSVQPLVTSTIEQEPKLQLNVLTEEPLGTVDPQIKIDNETIDSHKWCLNFGDEDQEIVIEDFDGSQLGSLRMAQTPSLNTSLPLAAISSVQEMIPVHEASHSVTPTQNLCFEYFTSTMNYKCTEPGCSKRFKSEQKLNKHKEAHNPTSGAKLTRHSSVECPVKKEVDGGIMSCGRIFITKDALLHHLDKDHNPEDAQYICSVCSRRFFWAIGLRAHSRTHCGQPAPTLTCAWPGCDRVFRQPCRLREHTRAHTGDKPYPCRYPNCGWSFRTASKLLRHTRRHTGERRHACGACGRAFRRREHLRDHAARHHRLKCICPHTGCSRTFMSAEAMSTHLQKVHGDATVFTEASFEGSLGSEGEGKDSLPMSLSSDCLESETRISLEAMATGDRAARTHCTWPLTRDAMPIEAVRPALVEDPEFVLEEDVQVEMSEGSESNIYTIRSDLFLHGNVLNNEDSEHMGGAGPLLVVPQTDTDLGLLDTHPTIDLMQEELMYTDSAVDESSFRVFLLSGEELV